MNRFTNMKRSFKLILIFSILFLISSFMVSAANLIHSYNFSNVNDLTGALNLANTGATSSEDIPSVSWAGTDSLNFDSGNYLSITNAAFSKPKALEIWFKYDSLASGAQAYMKSAIFGYDSTYWDIVILSTGALRYYYYDSSERYYDSNITTSIGTWYHLVVNSGATGSEMFINGVGVGRSSLTLQSHTGGLFQFSLGCAGNCGSDSNYWFNGRMDNFRVYDDVLNSTEIYNLYNCGSLTSCEAPPATEAENFKITAKNIIDNTAIQTFNATIDATTYQTYNGTIHTPLLNNDTSMYNIRIEAQSYLSKELSVYVNTDLVANLTPVNLEGFSISNYITLNDINYTRSLNYEYNYTCESSGTTNLYRIINGIVNKTTTLTCDNTTQTGNDYFNYSIEGRYNISFDYNTTFGNNTQKSQTYFISDLINPVVNNISFAFGSDFVLPSANVSMLCTDNIYSNLNYTLNLNGGLIFSGIKTNNTLQTNTTTALINGINNLTGICSDPFGSSTDSVLQNLELRTLYIINEQTNLGFNVQNLSSVRVYLDDNRTSYDFKANNKQNITFISTSDVKLRFELIYTDGTIILRYVDIGLLEDDIRVCANLEGITHYEQILTSSTTRPVILNSVFADCVVAADYTRFAYQNSKVLKAYTYNNLYYLYTFENNDPESTQTFLASVDGSIATYINLDSLEFNEQGYNIANTGDALAFANRNANEIEIYYFNTIQNNNEALRIVITNAETSEVYFNSTEFSDPNEAQIIFNIATLGLNETSILKATATRTIDGEDSDIVGYFNINGATGFIHAGVMFILSIILLVFGLSMTAANRAFGWFGLFIIIFNIAILSFSASAWYITFMQAVNIICMVYIFLVMTGKNSAQIG